MTAWDRVTTETATAWYRRALEIRGFEERIMGLFNRGLVRGSTHLASGQEAVAIGVAAALEPQDKLLCTYRGHHHCLARGMDPTAAFAEILGRRDGVCRGKGGSMHLTDVSTGLYGSYAVVGAHLPIAAGMAWAAKLRGTGEAVIAAFGDGTTTIGAFHEALGMAAVWSLPVVFLCENNQYSEYTPIGDVCPVPRPAADRAGAYGLEAVVLDGNDVAAVWDAATAAVARVRTGDGPVLLEAETYRHGGHSRTDPGTYRPQEEIEAWLARDPIDAIRRLLAERGLDDPAIARIAEEVDARLDGAVEAAVASPEPDTAELYTDVFAEVP